MQLIQSILYDCVYHSAPIIVCVLGGMFAYKANNYQGYSVYWKHPKQTSGDYIPGVYHDFPDVCGYVSYEIWYLCTSIW